MSWVVASLREGLSSNEWLQIQSNIRIAAGLRLQDAESRVHSFDNLSVIAVDLDLDRLSALEKVPGVILVVDGGRTANSPDGSWYARFGAACEKLLTDYNTVAGGVFRLSMAPPTRFSIPIDSNEFVQRTLRKAWQKGILPVIAAGNWGIAGGGTMSAWASSPFCVAVGAANVQGTRVADYSSRGEPGSRPRPTVVAPEEQIPPTGEVGTSFSAPIVSDVATMFMAFLNTFWQRSGRPPDDFKTIACDSVVKMIEACARPLPGAPHERGAGFVELLQAMDWLQNLSFSDAGKILPAFPFIDQPTFSDVRANVADLEKLVGGCPILHFVIDENFEWVRPLFVPGLHQFRGQFLFMQPEQLNEGDNIDSIVTPLGKATFVETTIYPWRLRGTVRRVGTAPTDLKTISAAMEASHSGDVIHIAAGRFDERIELRSGVTMIGESGTIISNSGTVLTADSVADISVRNIRFEVSASRMPAVALRSSNDIAFIGCSISSQTGNAVNCQLTDRLLFEDCELSGGINGGYFGLSQQLRFERCRIKAKGTGLLLVGASAFVHENQIQADLDGILYFGFDFPWYAKQETIVFVYPFVKYVYATNDIAMRAIVSQAPSAWLARLLFGLHVNKGVIRALRAGITANDFRFAILDNPAIVSGGPTHAVIDARLTANDVAGKSPEELLSLANKILSSRPIQPLQ